ncbi:MAG: hypothetical protein AAGN82_07900 [Myxococcota bacterium]
MSSFSPWDASKKVFYRWEAKTATLLEKVLRSPIVLQPSGALLTAAMKVKAKSDEAATLWWGNIGLPTKHDQERTLHKLNQLESRLMDLEEQLHEKHGHEKELRERSQTR